MDTLDKPDLAECVRFFLIEQFPGLSVIFTRKSTSTQYHPVETIYSEHPNIYVDGVHCGWLETDQYADLYNGNRYTVKMADPEFFPFMLRFVKRDLDLFSSRRWTVGGVPFFLPEAHHE